MPTTRLRLDRNYACGNKRAGTVEGERMSGTASYTQVAEVAVAREPLPLPILTSMRFFAALMVVAHHYDYKDFRLSYCGVTFFFILSGFILAVNYDGRNLHRFFGKRFARIYPTHLATALVVLPLGIAGLAQNLSLTQSYWIDPRIYWSLNSVSWSLSDEALFYALFPALLWLGSRRPGGLAVVVGLAFAALVTVAVAHPTSDPYFWYYIFPISRLPEFALGVLLGIIFLRNPRSVFPIFEPFALVAVALGAVAAHISNAALGQSVVFVPGFAITIYVFADGRGILARGFRHPWLVTLGESSFMLYMIHAPIARYVVRFSGLAHGNSLIAFPVSIVGSVLLWRYFEQPTRRWVLGISWGRVRNVVLTDRD